MVSRVRRAWEGLGVRDRDLHLVDETRGWLAIGDPDQLDQVLWALLDNAVKHGAGPIEALITADEERAAIHLRVIDHGPGVSPEDAIRLFQRFARGSAGSSGDGSGLGLYVARALAVTLKSGEHERLFQKYTTNIDAYDVFIRARHTVDVPSRSNIERLGSSGGFAAARSALCWAWHSGSIAS